MNEQKFWEIIDRVHDQSDGNMDTKCDLLKAELISLSDEEIKSFSNHFRKADVDAYTWPLWGAAYILQGGCSDDSFSDFRTTLISMGHDIYKNALLDPNTLSLVSFDENCPCYEGFGYVLNQVEEERFDEMQMPILQYPETPLGEEWDEDGVYDLFPSLRELEAYSNPRPLREIPEPRKEPWWKFW